MPAAAQQGPDERVVRLRALVRGRVQGVGFRAWTEYIATQFGIGGGRVRNLPDGTVEVEAEAADRPTLEALLQMLHQGPTAARVEGVEARWEEDVPPRFASFRAT